MNFERKTSQNQFLPILSKTQDPKLEKICQKFSSWRQFPSRPFATRHFSIQFLCNRVVIICGLPLVHMRFWLLKMMLNIGDTASIIPN